MAQKLSKNQEVVFPEESRFVIEEILKRYKLYRKPKEIMGKMAQEMRKARTFEEKKKIAERQPERKLARLVKNIAIGKIMLENLPKEIQGIFNISPKTAKELAKDLEKNVLSFAKKIFIKEEGVPPTRKPLIKPLPVAVPPKEPLEPPQPEPKVTPKVEKPASLERKPAPQKKDVYREPVE